MYENVTTYLSEREREFDRIPAERRAILKSIADFLSDRQRRQSPARLLFVCTHNSRRSQMAQIWSAAAAGYYGLPVPRVYSGGTESTAFNPRAVAALERAGMRIESTGDDENPVYLVRSGPGIPVVPAFSKRISEPPNPKADFCAVMVCDSADRACPNVSGAVARIALPFRDPKASDGTPTERETYDERCRDIAREMLFAMSLVRDSKR